MTEERRKTQATNYAKSNKIHVFDNGNSFWWLRTPGDDNFSVTDVSFDGSFNYNGNSERYMKGGVRPAMWINVGE